MSAVHYFYKPPIIISYSKQCAEIAVIDMLQNVFTYIVFFWLLRYKWVCTESFAVCVSLHKHLWFLRMHLSSGLWVKRRPKNVQRYESKEYYLMIFVNYIFLVQKVSPLPSRSHFRDKNFSSKLREREVNGQPDPIRALCTRTSVLAAQGTSGPHLQNTTCWSALTQVANSSMHPQPEDAHQCK